MTGVASDDGLAAEMVLIDLGDHPQHAARGLLGGLVVHPVFAVLSNFALLPLL
jgi:hypothetical protein